MNEMCPCCSGKHYQACCKPLHDGGYAENALALMRSRYCAYALKKPDYIIRTTHRSNPQYRPDIKAWKKEILSFCLNTLFEKLEILEFIDGEQLAYVTFLAYLKQRGSQICMKEKSLFEKSGQQWLYLDKL